MPKATMLMIDIGNHTGDLIPDDLKEILPVQGCSRYNDNFCLAAVLLEKEQIREICSSYERRIAIGAREIWDIFPEYRPEFHVNIQRTTLHGLAAGEVKLRDTIADDRITDLSIKLKDNGHFLIGGEKVERDEKIEICDESLYEYSYLKKQRDGKPINVYGKHLYFCRIFSIDYNQSPEFVPGIIFLSPSDLINFTNFNEIIDKKKQQEEERNNQFKELGMDIPYRFPDLPNDVSGVFVVDSNLVEPIGFGEAVIGRILSAAALAAGISGQITTMICLSEDGYQIQSRRLEGWSRPYQDNRLQWTNVISIENTIFNNIIKVISKSNINKFVASKEDYRLLAMDTIEDSRRPGVPALQFAQIWMGIERLLPFRHETSVQVCISLTALYKSKERPEAFKNFLRLYKLRSDIVHGYDFRRDLEIYNEIRYIGSIFRKMFRICSSDKFESVKDVRKTMLDHVLSGAEEPLSALH